MEIRKSKQEVKNVKSSALEWTYNPFFVFSEKSKLNQIPSKILKNISLVWAATMSRFVFLLGVLNYWNYNNKVSFFI